MIFTTCTFPVHFCQAGFNVCPKSARNTHLRNVNSFRGCLMPTSAPRPCSYAGCGVLVRDGTSRCEAHKTVERKQHDKLRGTAHERGYGVAWQKARAGFLRSHPLCRTHAAQQQVVAASVVDHIIPHKGDTTLFWQYSNWQALCKTCHDKKTAVEDGGFGR